jgi:PAS domain S-box-containing protein
LVFFPLMSEQGVLAEDALRVAAMALVLCIALGSYLVWYCTRYFFRPLRRFTEAAGAISRGSLEAEIKDFDARGEFGRLAEVFKRMAERLIRANADLEKTVAERTAELQERSRELELSQRATLNMMEDAALAMKKAEEANKQLIQEMAERARAEAKFRNLLESAPDAMVIVGDQGKIHFVNTQTEVIFGYKREELLGRPVEILVPERFPDGRLGERTGFFAKPRAGSGGAESDLYARRKDGTEFPVEISLSPLETEEGVIVSGAIRDITERKSQEDLRRKSLEEANRLKNEFLANMSHELRTPLNAIIGFSEMMYDGKLGVVSQEHKEYLGDILTSARHLLHLINDVLDLAKVEAGRIEFQTEPVELANVVWETCESVRALVENKRLKIETRIDPEVNAVHSDPGKLKQVLYNYLSNAIKFTADEGRIVVKAMPDGQSEFRIEVEDTGIGIRSEDLGKLFVEFQQLDSTLTKRYQGTGLGLALTKKLVEAQGGRVGVNSVFNRGSTFFAVLPRNLNAAIGSSKGWSNYSRESKRGASAEAGAELTRARWPGRRF